MVRIVSIGAAVQDVFLSGKVLKPSQEEDGTWVEELPLGAKLDLDGIDFSTGGGATNASVTFARQGLEAAFMGKVGHDPAGEAVLADLKREGVDTTLVTYSKKYATGYSTLLLAPTGERTILTYRGASTHYRVVNFNMNKAHADWYYISSLAGSMDVLEHVVNHAAANHIKVAINPGKNELRQTERLKKLLPHVTILTANKEEMQMLFEGETTAELAKNAVGTVDYAVVTDGPNGVAASDGKTLVAAGMYEDVPVIDRTGAGDAFGSGLTAKIASGASLREAIIFGSANSTSVVSYIGAKKGILDKNASLHDMDIKETEV